LSSYFKDGVHDADGIGFRSHQFPEGTFLFSVARTRRSALAGEAPTS
jgi:hypothetical protein